jgi:signal transduction histidine kinase
MSLLIQSEDLAKIQVLYVDDEPENLFGFKTALRRRFKILTAGSGKEALEILDRELIGVVISDQRMPEMTGVEMIRRAEEKHPDIVYMILTAYSDFEAMVKGINTGALSGYISKPWDRHEMEVTVATAIERYLLRCQIRDRNHELSKMNADLEMKVEKRTGDLRQAVDDLHVVNSDLSRLNQLKNEFIAFCSHDLKSPLSALTSFLDLMESRLEGKSGTEVAEDVINSMRDVIELMEGLVGRILDTSVLESGQEHLEIETKPLADSLAQTLRTAGALARSKEIALRVEIDPDLSPIPHDSTRFNQVVGNLISNAVKFTDSGGHITISIRRDQDDSQRITVADSGIGMAPDACREVFTNGKAHRRLGTAGERSSGMGLGICQRIVALHGGHIWVESEPHQGSQFHVTLPAEQPAELTRPNGRPS